MFAIALLIAISPIVFATNVNGPNSSSGSKQRKTTQRQKRALGTCDPQMKKINGVCRFTGMKLELTQPIIINAGDPPYDCGGGYLVPPSLSTSTDPANDPNRYQAPSSPQVGIFVSNRLTL